MTYFTLTHILRVPYRKYVSILGNGPRVRRGRPEELGLESLDLLGERARQALRRTGDRYTVWPGQVVLAEGAQVNWVFVVLSGELTLCRRGRQARVLGAGATYGALEAVMSSAAPGDLVARDVTEVLALPVRSYRALIETHPDFASWIIRSLAAEQAGR